MLRWIPYTLLWSLSRSDNKFHCGCNGYGAKAPCLERSGRRTLRKERATIGATFNKRSGYVATGNKKLGDEALRRKQQRGALLDNFILTRSGKHLLVERREQAVA